MDGAADHFSFGNTLSYALSRVSILSGLIAACLLLGASDDRRGTAYREAETGEFTSGHRKMLAILQRIKERAPREHLYFGRGVIDEIQAQLDRLGPDATIGTRLTLLQQLGINRLSYDETPHQAIEVLTEAIQLYSQANLPKAVATRQVTITCFYLGLAYLRLGEVDNCCASHNQHSCIVPIIGGGLHTNEQGSRNAIKYFGQLLDFFGVQSQREASKKSTRREENLDLRMAALWLLNIAFMTLDEYPDGVPEKYRISPEFFQSQVEFPRFENVEPKLNLNTYNHAGGAIVDDFDNDDYLDIFTTSSDPTIQTRFFRNNQDGTFTDRTEAAGLIGLYGGLNMVQADYNNDGNVDVYILRGAWMGEQGRHPNSLLRNNGDGTFTDVTFDAGLGEVHYPAKTAAWADYDNDGDLDLYVANEGDHSVHRNSVRQLSAPAQLFRNNGNGTFQDVARQANVRIERFAMGTVWGDYNGDRFPDIFVSGNFAGQVGLTLFRSNGDGTFTDVARTVGFNRPRLSWAGWFWDFDNDGALDLYVANACGDVSVLALYAISEQTTREGRDHVHVRSRDGRTRMYEMPALYRGDGRRRIC